MDFIKNLTFTEAIQLAVSRFFEFEGRSRRSEYWWVILALLVLSAIIPIGVIGPDYCSVDIPSSA